MAQNFNPSEHRYYNFRTFEKFIQENSASFKDLTNDFIRSVALEKSEIDSEQFATIVEKSTDLKLLKKIMEHPKCTEKALETVFTKLTYSTKVTLVNNFFKHENSSLKLLEMSYNLINSTSTASDILKNTHAPKLPIITLDLLKMYKGYTKSIPQELSKDIKNYKNALITSIGEYISHKHSIHVLINKIRDGYKNFSNKFLEMKVEYYKYFAVHGVLTYSSPLDYYNILSAFLQLKKLNKSLREDEDNITIKPNDINGNQNANNNKPEKPSTENAETQTDEQLIEQNLLEETIVLQLPNAEEQSDEGTEEQLDGDFHSCESDTDSTEL